jgi:hypothetical protein
MIIAAIIHHRFWIGCVISVLVRRKNLKWKQKSAWSQPSDERAVADSLQRARSLFCAEIFVLFPAESRCAGSKRAFKPKTRERKLRSGVNWQGTLKQRGVKQTVRKQVLRIFSGFVTFPDNSIFFYLHMNCWNASRQGARQNVTN